MLATFNLKRNNTYNDMLKRVSWMKVKLRFIKVENIVDNQIELKGAEYYIDDRDEFIALQKICS